MGQEQKEYAWKMIAKKLSGEASPEELQELERLLRNNPELYFPMQTLSDLWNPAEPGDQKEAEQAFDRHLDRMRELNVSPFPRNRTKTTQRRILIGSLLAAASVVGILFAVHFAGYRMPSTDHPTGNTRINSEISTRKGSKTHLVLPDGTLVWLNAESRITYDKNYGVTHREINLVGEAFFDVFHNADRPFVIHAAKIDIKVLGTRFNVKAYPTDKTTEATLVRGSIEISIKARPSEKIILRPNEKLVVDNDDSTLQRNNPGQPADTDEALVSIRKPTYESATGAIIETSWVDNKLIFQDEVFGDLARQMERWYGVTIRFENQELTGWRFTGIFQNETIQQALDALTLTANFKYKMEGNQITIYEK